MDQAWASNAVYITSHHGRMYISELCDTLTVCEIYYYTYPYVKYVAPL